MWKDVYQLSVSPWNLLFRGLVVYLAILLLLRLAGKRQMGQTTPTEFVALLLISNAVQNAMNAGDNSLTGGLILAVVLVLCSWIISWLTYRSKKARQLFEGTPTLLIHHGKILDVNLTKERVTHSDLISLLRRQGIHELPRVQSAVLESDGSLSVLLFPKD